MKKDYRTERFSKANVAEHIASLMRDEADLFKKAEGTACLLYTSPSPRDS